MVPFIIPSGIGREVPCPLVTEFGWGRFLEMRANELIRFLVNDGTQVKNFAWASIQPDGSLSVGLADRLFRMTHMTETLDVDGKRATRTVDLLGLHGEEAVTNPHFTYHPPLYHHLRRNDTRELWEGIMDIPIMLSDGEEIPWIRLESNPVRNLRPFASARTGTEHQLEINAGFAQSVGVSFDFAPKRPQPRELASRLVPHLPSCDVIVRWGVMPEKQSNLIWCWYG